ncbi:MAG: MATE family efflux transporter, partial [Deltaproteobacteria bacterium]
IIAAYGIGMRVDQFSFLPAMSLGSSVSAMVAQHIGAEKIDKIPKIMLNAMMISLGFALIFYIPVNLFPTQIAALFTDHVPVGVPCLQSSQTPVPRRYCGVFGSPCGRTERSASV